MYGRVYLRLMLYIQYVYTAQNLRYNNYGAPWWTIFGDELSALCWVVDAMFPPSIFEDRCVDLRRSMIDVSTFEDRCVDFRRSTIDVPTFEDRWCCVDLRRPMALCRPSKTDDPCEIMLPHLLETLMV